MEKSSEKENKIYLAVVEYAYNYTMQSSINTLQAYNYVARQVI